MTTLEQIREDIDRLHYHPKLDFIKNDEVVEMALDIIDKYTDQSLHEDAVSRKAVIDALYDLFGVANDRLVYIPWCASAIDARINALPSVYQKQKGGEV